MNLDKAFSIAGAIVTLAIVSTLVIHGSDTAQVIKATGDMFSGSIRAAMGN